MSDARTAKRSDGSGLPKPARESPLESIHQLERRVAARIESARAAAEKRLEEARAEAQRRRETARQAGEAAAHRRTESGLKEARSQAEVIRRRGEAGLEALRQQFEARIPELARQILDVVLPIDPWWEGPSESSRESEEG